MFKEITFAIVGEYYIPFMYKLEGTNKQISVGDLIKGQDLPANHAFFMMAIPNDPSVPQEISGLCVPILCEVKSNGYYPLMSEAFLKYGVQYFPTEKNMDVIVYLTKLHQYIMGGQSPLGDVSNFIVDYNTIYAQFYNSYSTAMQQQQQATQTAQEPAQEVVQETVEEETVEEPAQEQVQEPVQEVVEEPVQEPTQEQVQETVEEAASAVQGFGGTTTPAQKPQITTQASAEVVENFLNLVTNNSGGYIEITSVPSEQIQATVNAIKALPPIPSSFDEIPAFIPNVRKLPVGAVDLVEARAENPGLSYVGMSGISFKDFEKQVIDYINTQEIDIKGNQQLSVFESELEQIFAHKIPIRQLLEVFNPEFSNNLELLYELTKYVVMEESPNGLYDNTFLLCYIIEHELRLQGKTANTSNHKVASTLARLACDVKRFEAEEEQLKSKEDSDTDSLREAGFIFNAYKEEIRCANDVIKNLVVDLLASNKDIKCQLTGGANLTTLRKACILSRLGIAFMIKDNPILATQGFDTLNIIIREYSVNFIYFGIPIDHTALGNCIYELTFLETQRNKQDGNPISLLSEESYREEYQSVLKNNSYQNCLSNLKENNPYISNSTRSAAEPVDIRGLDLELIKYVISVYNGKPTPTAVILKNNAPNANIRERFLLCPFISALYKEMANCNIMIKGLYNSPEDLKSVKYYNNNGYVRELSMLHFDKTDKSKFVVINISNPLLNLQEIQKQLSGKTINDVDVKTLRIPSWTRGDVGGITEGLKSLFNVI